MDPVIDATEEFARIGNAFRRRFLDQTDGEGETVDRRFDEAIELGPRKLTLLLRAEEKRGAFADHGVAFALAAPARRGAIEFLSRFD